MQFADGFVTAAAAQPSMVVLFRAVNGEPSTFGLNQTAQQSTRSERRDRCLVNAHFNLNEPRTALRKHKVGDWNGQARGTVAMTPAADVEGPEASSRTSSRWQLLCTHAATRATRTATSRPRLLSPRPALQRGQRRARPARAPAHQDSNTLQSVVLSMDWLGKATMAAMADALQSNHTLHKLCFEFPHCNMEDILRNNGNSADKGAKRRHIQTRRGGTRRSAPSL